MATRKPTPVKRAAPVQAPAAPATAAPRARRPGAVRRTKTSAPPALAAAPEIHEIHEILEIREEQFASATATADEQIRVRAYYLHLERRGRPADPASDWLRAEQELAGRGHRFGLLSAASAGRAARG